MSFVYSYCYFSFILVCKLLCTYIEFNLEISVFFNNTVSYLSQHFCFGKCNCIFVYTLSVIMSMYRRSIGYHMTYRSTPVGIKVMCCSSFRLPCIHYSYDRCTPCYSKFMVIFSVFFIPCQF